MERSRPIAIAGIHVCTLRMNSDKLCWLEMTSRQCYDQRRRKVAIHILWVLANQVFYDYEILEYAQCGVV